MIDPKYHNRLSRFLSMVLRHKPETIGISLDKHGWTDVHKLIEKMNAYGKRIDFETLEMILETNNKKRYSFNDDKSQIRANQGHSVEIDLAYSPKTPPAKLFHGTALKNVDSICKTGIKKKDRHHVHLSKDINTAISVGKRHGKPVVFEILTEEMTKEGFEFYESANGVWLTDSVPVRFLRKIEK